MLGVGHVTTAVPVATCLSSTNYYMYSMIVISSNKTTIIIAIDILSICPFHCDQFNRL
jgi:hypothetical protein